MYANNLRVNCLQPVCHCLAVSGVQANSLRRPALFSVAADTDI